MGPGDIGAAADVYGAAVGADDSDSVRRQRLVRALERFPEVDPEGAWLAVVDGQIAGFATGVRRGRLWGLSTLFVHPRFQSRGIGGALFARACNYGADAELAMVVSSADPRALRRYAKAGFTLHPTIRATGSVDRSALQAGLGVREGSVADLDLVAEVDQRTRGSSRVPDVEFLLSEGARLRVLDRAGARGWALHFDGAPIVLGNPIILAADGEDLARALLWDFLGSSSGELTFHTWTSAQHWAADVAVAANLRLAPDAALFVRGASRPPGPWLGSGLYF